MAATTVWGLDIGNSGIKIVKMQKVSPTECVIVDFDIVDIPVGEDEKDRPARLQTAMNTLTSNHKFGNDHVYVSVAGNVCLHREFQLPPGSEEKLQDLVTYEAKQQIPFPLDQVEWGFERYEDPNGVGVALIAVRKNDIQDLMNLCKALRLNVRGITAAPMCLFNFIHYEFRPENTTLILDAGAKGTDFVVMNRRQVYFRTIQIAGREITRVLENKFKVSYDKAEDLKKNIAKSPQLAKILAVIEPTLRQLGAEVQRTIGFYKSRARGQRIHQCYLLGHTFRLPKMAEYLQSQVREAPFALVEGLQRVKLAENINPDVWNTEFPTMAVAIGLGLQGLGLSELTLNLIPGETKTQVAVDKWKPWAAGAAALVMATLYFSYAQATSANVLYDKQVKSLTVMEQEAKKYDADEKTAIAGIPEKKALATRWARVGHDRGKIPQVFNALAAMRTPEGKPFFGQENKIFLTGLQVSRMPIGSGGGLPPVPEREALKGADALNGPRSLYASLAKPNAEDPLSLPLELRPDVPLVAILTGEVESGPAAIKTVSALEELLKKMPEIKEVRMDRGENGPVYIEQLAEYDWEGKLKVAGSGAAPAPNAAAEQGKKVQYSTFSAILRWNDPNDPDLEPTERAPQNNVPTAKKDSKKPATK